MFFRLKQSGSRRYLQIVDNRRENGAVRQHVIATLGRLDELAARSAWPPCWPPAPATATRSWRCRRSRMRTAPPA